MDRLAQAARHLARIQERYCSQWVSYRRAASNAAVLATVGKTDFQNDQGDGLITKYQSRDYLISREALVLDDLRIEPAAGDQIIERDPDGGEGGDGIIYEVMSLNGQPVWSWADDFRHRYRIHTKYAGRLAPGEFP